MAWNSKASRHDKLKSVAGLYGPQLDKFFGESFWQAVFRSGPTNVILEDTEIRSLIYENIVAAHDELSSVDALYEVEFRLIYGELCEEVGNSISGWISRLGQEAAKLLCSEMWEIVRGFMHHIGLTLKLGYRIRPAPSISIDHTLASLFRSEVDNIVLKHTSKVRYEELASLKSDMAFLTRCDDFMIKAKANVISNFKLDPQEVSYSLHTSLTDAIHGKLGIEHVSDDVRKVDEKERDAWVRLVSSDSRQPRYERDQGRTVMVNLRAEIRRYPKIENFDAFEEFFNDMGPTSFRVTLDVYIQKLREIKLRPIFTEPDTKGTKIILNKDAVAEVDKADREAKAALRRVVKAKLDNLRKNINQQQPELIRTGQRKYHDSSASSSSFEDLDSEEGSESYRSSQGPEMNNNANGFHDMVIHLDPGTDFSESGKILDTNRELKPLPISRVPAGKEDSSATEKLDFEAVHKDAFDAFFASLSSKEPSVRVPGMPEPFRLRTSMMRQINDVHHIFLSLDPLYNVEVDAVLYELDLELKKIFTEWCRPFSKQPFVNSDRKVALLILLRELKVNVRLEHPSVDALRMRPYYEIRLFSYVATKVTKIHAEKIANQIGNLILSANFLETHEPYFEECRELWQQQRASLEKAPTCEDHQMHGPCVEECRELRHQQRASLEKALFSKCCQMCRDIRKGQQRDIVDAMSQEYRTSIYTDWLMLVQKVYEDFDLKVDNAVYLSGELCRLIAKEESFRDQSAVTALANDQGSGSLQSIIKISMLKHMEANSTVLSTRESLALLGSRDRLLESVTRLIKESIRFEEDCAKVVDYTRDWLKKWRDKYDEEYKLAFKVLRKPGKPPSKYNNGSTDFDTIKRKWSLAPELQAMYNELIEFSRGLATTHDLDKILMKALKNFSFPTDTDYQDMERVVCSMRQKHTQPQSFSRNLSRKLAASILNEPQMQQLCSHENVKMNICGIMKSKIVRCISNIESDWKDPYARVVDGSEFYRFLFLKVKDTENKVTQENDLNKKHVWNVSVEGKVIKTETTIDQIIIDEIAIVFDSTKILQKTLTEYMSNMCRELTRIAGDSLTKVSEIEKHLNQFVEQPSDYGES